MPCPIQRIWKTWRFPGWTDCFGSARGFYLDLVNGESNRKGKIALDSRVEISRPHENKHMSIHIYYSAVFTRCECNQVSSEAPPTMERASSLVVKTRATRCRWAPLAEIDTDKNDGVRRWVRRLAQDCDPGGDHLRWVVDCHHRDRIKNFRLAIQSSSTTARLPLRLKNK